MFPAYIFSAIDILSSFETLFGIAISIITLNALIYKGLIKPLVKARINDLMKNTNQIGGKYIQEQELNSVIEQKLHDLMAKMNETINAQLRPNGGGSLVDRIPRIENDLKGNTRLIEAIKDDMEDVKVTAASVNSGLDSAIKRLDEKTEILNANLTLLLKKILDTDQS